MDFFNFFPSLEKSNEAYFGLDSPLSQDLINYANKLKELIQNVDDTKFKNREFMKKVNSILIDFGEAVKLDINAESVKFLLVPDDTLNAAAYPIFIRANTTVKDKYGNINIDLDKIADIEDIIVTSEGYKYRNSKNKLLCVKINKGLIQQCEPEIIAGVIAHELGHCFQDGIFGVYKDVADITFSQLMENSAHVVEMFRSTMPKFIQGLTKIVGFRLLFIIFTYLCFPQYLFTSGLFSGLGAKLAKLSNKLAHKNTTLRMKDQLEKIDNGDNKIRSGLQNSQATQILTYINKDNDRNKFIKELEKNNKEEWKIYLENCKNLEPVASKFKEFWERMVRKFDNLDTRIVRLLTLSRFTNKTYAKVTFFKRWEFFADIFATSYGFGPETYRFLSSVIDNYLESNNGMSMYDKYHIYKTYLESCEYDVHGTNKQRLQNIYTDLVHEIQNNTHLTSEQKKQIQLQIDQLTVISEQVYENRKSNSKSLFTKAYNRLIDDRINGINHDTEEEILKPIDDLCKEVFVGKHKKEIQNSIEHLII